MASNHKQIRPIRTFSNLKALLRKMGIGMKDMRVIKNIKYFITPKAKRI